jgi:hypothetical protein
MAVVVGATVWPSRLTMLAEVTFARVANVRSMYAREYCVIWKHDTTHTNAK